MKLSTLKKQAQKTTASRGHKMKWGQVFGRGGYRGLGQTGTCQCGCYVQILEKPYPNEINIGGSALARNCK